MSDDEDSSTGPIVVRDKPTYAELEAMLIRLREENKKLTNECGALADEINRLMNDIKDI